jgi:hypothetical protein
VRLWRLRIERTGGVHTKNLILALPCFL